MIITALTTQATYSGNWLQATYNGSWVFVRIGEWIEISVW